jgi:hypothetical protein
MPFRRRDDGGGGVTGSGRNQREFSIETACCHKDFTVFSRYAAR